MSQKKNIQKYKTIILSEVDLTFYFAAKTTKYMRAFELIAIAEYLFLLLLYALQSIKVRLIMLSFHALENSE